MVIHLSLPASERFYSCQTGKGLGTKGEDGIHVFYAPCCTILGRLRIREMRLNIEMKENHMIACSVIFMRLVDP